jgi:glucose-6-phosphate-specific signal transduction histidine kinase
MLGVLLLGERNDDSLYTQEEIEVAQATGERVLQAQASAELTRRLIDLQRGRLAATQVVDRRARRILHDDILPQLHTAMLSLSAGETAQAQTQMIDVHRALSELLREMPAGASPQVERYGVLGALRRAVDEEFANAFDAVTWNIEPEAATRAQGLAALNAEVLYAAAREAIRNAAKHGRGGDKGRALHLCVGARWHEGLLLEIEDDGVGIGAPSPNGGQGLQLHSTMMAVVGGSFVTEGGKGRTCVTLALPEKVM